MSNSRSRAWIRFIREEVPMSSSHARVRNFLGGIGLLFLMLITAGCGGGGSDTNSAPPQATGRQEAAHEKPLFDRLFAPDPLTSNPRFAGPRRCAAGRQQRLYRNHQRRIPPAWR